MKNFSKLVVDSKSDNCLVTLQLNCKEKNLLYDKIGKCTLPLMEVYAKKQKVNFEIINNNLLLENKTWQGNVWSKLHTFDLLEKYEKVFFVDLDCYISEKCESVFEKYANAEFVCAYFNSTGKIEGCNKLAKKLNLPDAKIYINSGVFLADRSIKDVFKFPNFEYIENDHFGAAEENWMNLILSENQQILTKLDFKYNDCLNTSNFKIFHAVLYKNEKKFEILDNICYREKIKKISLL